MHAQDPFIYKGRLGYHVVCHDMERGDKSESDGCRFQGYEGCSGQVGLHSMREVYYTKTKHQTVRSAAPLRPN